MTHHDYAHRSVVDKLGIKPVHRVACDAQTGPIPESLCQAIEECASPEHPPLTEAYDVVLVTVDSTSDVTTLLALWRRRIVPAGGIWLLTPKRGHPGYLNQTELISAGAEAGLVDNKICSISDTTSAMRFVIRRVDRPQ